VLEIEKSNYHKGKVIFALNSSRILIKAIIDWYLVEIEIENKKKR